MLIQKVSVLFCFCEWFDCIVAFHDVLLLYTVFVFPLFGDPHMQIPLFFVVVICDNSLGFAVTEIFPRISSLCFWLEYLSRVNEFLHLVLRFPFTCNVHIQVKLGTHGFASLPHLPIVVQSFPVYVVSYGVLVFFCSINHLGFFASFDVN